MFRNTSSLLNRSSAATFNSMCDYHFRKAGNDNSSLITCDRLYVSYIPFSIYVSSSDEVVIKIVTTKEDNEIIIQSKYENLSQLLDVPVVVIRKIDEEDLL